jgi:hypothetical protein
LWHVLSDIGVEYAACAGTHGAQYSPGRGWLCAADGGGSREVKLIYREAELIACETGLTYCETGPIF